MKTTIYFLIALLLILIFLIIIFLLTLIFNGYLTARPVVIYNPEVITNLRIGTIPIEDMIYGLVLIIGLITIYENKNKKLN